MSQELFNKKFIECITGSQHVDELLPLLKDTARLNPLRALEVYREDYQVRLAEALKNTFRATHSILGDDDFFKAALQFIQLCPSSYSDLDEYGGEFPEFLLQHTLIDDYPFLQELSQFEWSFRDVFHVKEIKGLDATELQQYLADDSILLHLTPSARLLSYDHAIDRIYALKDSDEPENDFEVRQNTYILLFKKNSLVKMHTLSKNQWTFLKKFHTPCSLISSIHCAPATMTPDEIQELFLILGTEQILLKSF